MASTRMPTQHFQPLAWPEVRQQDLEDHSRCERKEMDTEDGDPPLLEALQVARLRHSFLEQEEWLIRMEHLLLKEPPCLMPAPATH